MTTDENPIEAAKNEKTPNDDLSADSELLRYFSLPPKIRTVKILIAIAEFLMGGGIIAVAFWYFLGSTSKTTFYSFLAVMAVIIGVAMALWLFPTDLAKALNSKLLLGEKTIQYRNSFVWKAVPWKNVQEILINEKLSSDPKTNEVIGIGVVRFRTVTDGYYFFADSYPIEECQQLKDSLREAFLLAVKDDGYTVIEEIERPSTRTRQIYYKKTIDKTQEVIVSS